MIHIRIIFIALLVLLIPTLDFAQTYNFNDGTAQGWYATGPYDENGYSDFTSNFSQLYWDTQTNYPNPLGQDPVGENNGSITLVADNGHGITAPNSTWWMMRIHSENLAELEEWQNADGYSVQINEDMGSILYANFYVRVFDFSQQQDRFFYSGTAQPLTSNSWNSFTFNNWSSLSNFPTNYQVMEIFINIWGLLSNNYFYNGPVSIDQVVPIPRTSDITIGTVPSGLDIVVDGQTYTSPQTFDWIVGSQHNINTNSPQSGGNGIRYLFNYWSNQGAQSHTITVPANDASVTAYFSTQYYLTMTSGTGGTVSPTSSWHDAETDVQITATPADAYSFASWTGSGSGSYSGTNNPANITINGPITETASFTLNSVAITINTNIAGRSFNVDGTNYTSEQVFDWQPGSQHTIATSTPQSGEAGVQYIFDNWSDGGTISHDITTPGTATTYTANFTTQYYLTMTSGTGGTVSPTSSWHDAETDVQITATPADAYSFASWTGSGSGSYSGTNNPANITINGPITETASFTLNSVAITINTNIAGRSFNVDGTNYTSEQVFDWQPGSQHTIATSTPQSGATDVQYIFDDWSDGGAISHDITTPGTATTYTANFITQYYLTTQSEPDLGGTVAPSEEWYDSGEQVQISAVVNSGYEFVEWEGTGTGSYNGTDNPATITMDTPITQKAIYSLIDEIELLDQAIPTEFALHHNYPNPFNPSTTISFSIPKGEYVSIRIYNLLGMEVATLVDRELSIGNYAYSWDATGIAGGVYYYMIRAGNFQEVKKMVLVK